jgi:hypothetical protein
LPLSRVEKILFQNKCTFLPNHYFTAHINDFSSIYFFLISSKVDDLIKEQEAIAEKIKDVVVAMQQKMQEAALEKM